MTSVTAPPDVAVPPDEYAGATGEKYLHVSTSEGLRSGESDDESLPASRTRDIPQLADIGHAEICGAW